MSPQQWHITGLTAAIQSSSMVRCAPSRGQLLARAVRALCFRASLSPQPLLLSAHPQPKAIHPCKVTMQLGKEAIRIRSTIHYIYVYALFIWVPSSQLLQTPQDSWDHIPLPFLLLEKGEIGREGGRQTYSCPHYRIRAFNLFTIPKPSCRREWNTSLMNKREWNTSHLDLGKVMTSDEAAVWNVTESCFIHNKASRKTKFSLLASTPGSDCRWDSGSPKNQMLNHSKKIKKMSCSIKHTYVNLSLLHL